MALSPERIKTLAMELAAAMPPMPPRLVMVVASTGERYSVDALQVARAYDDANHFQQQALEALVASWEKTP